MFPPYYRLVIASRLIWALNSSLLHIHHNLFKIRLQMWPSTGGIAQTYAWVHFKSGR